MIARARTIRMAVVLLGAVLATCLVLAAGCSSGTSNGADKSATSMTSGTASSTVSGTVSDAASGASSSVASKASTANEALADNEALAKIISADGKVLAESQAGPNGSFSRSYPADSRASFVVGSRYTAGAPEGIEQRFEEALAAGQDVHLTIDSRIQNAAVEALGRCVGAAVVLNPNTGAVLAMVSAPSYDPASAGTASETPNDEPLVNRATEPHIPGSTFKTITLAAALESETITPNERIDAPADLVFPNGLLSNYDHEQHLGITLSQAFAQSVNTAFAQLALSTGAQSVIDKADCLGFDTSLMNDFSIPASTMNGVSDEDAYGLALTGMGQAQFQEDGTISGPLMTPVQGAVIASAVVNGGTAYRPYLVESIGDTPTAAAASPEPLSGQAFSPETASFISEAMLNVVNQGTGTSAAVPGVTVGGKTGTAETVSGEDDGWFIGFAEHGGEKYAFAVLVEGSDSAEATKVASNLIEGLFV